MGLPPDPDIDSFLRVREGRVGTHWLAVLPPQWCGEILAHEQKKQSTDTPQHSRSGKEEPCCPAAGQPAHSI